MNFDEEQIERGRKLHRLLGSNDFTPFLEELNKRIEKFREQILDYRSGSFPVDLGAQEYRPRFQELIDLKEWINEEIEAGGNELIRKNAAQVEIEASEK